MIIEWASEDAVSLSQKSLELSSPDADKAPHASQGGLMGLWVQAPMGEGNILRRAKADPGL